MKGSNLVVSKLAQYGTKANSLNDPSEAERTMNMYNVNVNVRHDGQCTWLPPTKFKTSCDIDMQYFPFDTQTCSIKLGSWAS